MEISQITNKDELISKIVNQVNSLNKKIKKFDNKEVTAHKEYRENFLGDLVKYSDTGTITKSKKFYKEKSVLELQKILAITHKVNNHEILGTEKKYNNAVTATISKIMEYSKKLLREKGYSEQWILEVVNNKSFIYKLLDELNKGAKTYGSDNIIEKVALTFGEDIDDIDTNAMKRALNDIETTQRALDEILETNRNLPPLERQRRGTRR